VTVTAGEPRAAFPDGAPDDPEDFAEWLRPHLRTVANLVARLAPSADRDDVVQEALARAWVKRRLFDSGRGSPAAWLLAIAADQAAKARRRARPTEELTETVGPASAGELAGRVDVERALARLSRRQRLAVDCVYFVGLSVAETAAVMGCSEGTVKSTLHDARAKLRNLLEVSP
jgi:RNA polymerase sigma factor (sigma-70 family)